MTPEQHGRAVHLMQRNLAHENDWIVLITTIETLDLWSRDDADLASWLTTHVAHLAQESRKSVAGRAAKLAAAGWDGGRARPAPPAERP